MRVRSRLGLVVAATAAVVFGVGAPVGADVITPPGACGASGEWTQADFVERVKDHETSDVIKIPRTDVVRWRGNIKGSVPGEEVERRPISGRVQLDLPFGQKITVNDWGGTSVKAANRGRRGYNLPPFFSGVKMKLSGHHDENGQRVCSGSVYLQVEGGAASNPLTWAAVVGLILSGGLLFWAGRARANGPDDGEGAARTRGRPVLGALAGFVLGGSLGALLLPLGVLALDSVVLVILPFVGLVIGLVWAFLAPVGRST